MKKLIGFLFVMFVFVGCGEDKGPDKEPISIYDGIFPYEYFEYAYHVDDFNAFNKNSIWGVIGKDTTWVLGVKNQKRWVGIFDEHSKTLLKEWKGIETVTEPDKTIQCRQSEFFKKTDAGEILIMVSEENKDMPSNIFFHLTNTLQLKEIRFPEPYRLSLNFQLLAGNKIFGMYRDKEENFLGLFSLDGTVLINSIYENKTENGDSLFLSGFKGDKVWFANCDKNYLFQEEWTGVEKFNRNIKIHVGYGEYEEYYVDLMAINKQSVKMDWGYAIVPQYNKRDLTVSDIFLLNNGNAYYYSSPLGMPQLSGWYKESILVNGKIVLSPEGKVLAELATSCEGAESLSYTTGILAKFYGAEGGLSCIDFKEDKTIWETSIVAPFTIQSNAKLTVTILKKNNQIWDYQCDVLNYDGSKQQFNFSINIETGELIK